MVILIIIVLLDSSLASDIVPGFSKFDQYFNGGWLQGENFLEVDLTRNIGYNFEVLVHNWGDLGNHAKNCSS
jgi:hypothetical protein